MVAGFDVSEIALTFCRSGISQRLARASVPHFSLNLKALSLIPVWMCTTGDDVGCPGRLVIWAGSYFGWTKAIK